MKLNVIGKLFLISIKTQKYRKELTPNITFEPNKIFGRNDWFEKVIKSCKTTKSEFLKLKGKLGLCLYEKEFILMSEKIITYHDIENKQLKEKKKKLNVNENVNENENESENKNENENENQNKNKSKIVKDADIK